MRNQKNPHKPESPGRSPKEGLPNLRPRRHQEKQSRNGRLRYQLPNSGLPSKPLRTTPPVPDASRFPPRIPESPEFRDPGSGIAPRSKVRVPHFPRGLPRPQSRGEQCLLKRMPAQPPVPGPDLRTPERALPKFRCLRSHRSSPSDSPARTVLCLRPSVLHLQPR